MPKLTLLALVLVANAACLRSTEFKCASNDECGASGTCELGVGFCSFPDSQCGQRFGNSAGPYANQCVGGVVDGGTDGRITDGRIVDAPGCPADYVALPGDPGHRYKVIAATDWTSQVAACATASPLTYLGIPDSAAEVTGYDTLITTASYWVGISEGSGNFTTVKDAPQTFLPWANGQPNAGGGATCVEVAATGPMAGKFDLQKCSDARPAICECEP